MSDPEYRALFGEWGVSSHKDLTRREASDLLRALGRPLARRPGEQPPRPPRPRPAPAPLGVTPLPTPEQRRLIGELASEIEWGQPDGLAGWLKHNQGIERVATSEQAWRAIEGARSSGGERGRERPIRHVPGHAVGDRARPASPEYSAAPSGAGAGMIALAICTALAERRTIYVPLPSTIRRRMNRAARDTLICSMFRHGTHPNRIASHVGLSPRQVRRILHRHTETLD